ncbi:helix-turn-helix domain-containing protein [Actinomadura gamaensis]|uniref:Helix-turn-helix domain-containing protein n=1 Tax=Actinomadura gamaensis TaxID=1763541 RepID=A0ABV9U9M2_9ACTN
MTVGAGAGAEPSVPLARLTAAAREEAVRRFGILRPHLEEGVSLSEVARTGEVSVRTAERWAARYRRGGLAALAPRPRKDVDRRRMPEELQLVIEALALRTPRLSAAAVHRRVQELAPEHGWPVPSYRTVVNVIAALDPALTCLAHQGRKRYADVFELIGRREVDAPNASWQADHTELDFYILTEDGTPARPWLTLIIDEYSRAVAAHRLSLEEADRNTGERGASGLAESVDGPHARSDQHPAPDLPKPGADPIRSDPHFRPSFSPLAWPSEVPAVSGY